MEKERGERRCKLQSLEVESRDTVDVAQWNVSVGYRADRSLQRALSRGLSTGCNTGRVPGQRGRGGRGDPGNLRAVSETGIKGWSIRIAGQVLFCRFPVPPGESPWRLVHVGVAPLGRLLAGFHWIEPDGILNGYFSLFAKYNSDSQTLNFGRSANVDE